MFSLLLIGPPGSGKTTVAATAPGPVGFIDFDNKMHKMYNLQAKIASGRIIQIPIDTSLSKIGLRRLVVTKHDQGGKFETAYPEGYMKFVDIVEALEASQGVWNGIKLGTIVLDSYTTMQEHLKRMLLAANSKSTMTLPLYGAMLVNLEEVDNAFLSKLNKFMNVILICHEKLEKDELTQQIHYRPLIEGQMDNKIGKDFEEVYWMQKTIEGFGTNAKAIYTMMTVGDNMHACRTSRNLPAVVEGDLCKIYGMKEML